MRRLLPLIVAGALAVSLVPAPRSAHAQSAADKETARGLMTEGRDKREKGDHEGALAAFRAAHKIMGVPTTGLEVGRSEAELGLLIEARDTLLAVTRIPVKPGEPEPFARARAEAEKLADAIAPRIPSVKIVAKGLAPSAEATLTFDGVPASGGVLGIARKMNPGEHVVVVRANEREKKAAFTLTEGESREVEVDFTGAVAAPVTTAPAPRPVDAPHTRTISPLVYGGFALAAVGAIAGGVTGAMHLSRTSSLRDRCPDDRCGPDAHADYDSARTLGTISTISFAAAGAGVVLGVIGLVTSRSEPSPTVGLALGAFSATLIGRF